MSETETAPGAEAADPQLSELFDASHVVAEIGVATRDGVVAKLVKAVEGKGLLTDARWLETALKERERMVPTAMPNGVAFMHARHRAAEKFRRQFLFLARSAKGVAFGSPDEKPTHLFFLLALRKDMAHLRWLARLSWICRNRATVASLLKAKNAEDIARILLNAGVPPTRLAVVQQHLDGGGRPVAKHKHPAAEGIMLQCLAAVSGQTFDAPPEIHGLDRDQNPHLGSGLNHCWQLQKLPLNATALGLGAATYLKIRLASQPGGAWHLDIFDRP